MSHIHLTPFTVSIEPLCLHFVSTLSELTNSQSKDKLHTPVLEYGFPCRIPPALKQRLDDGTDIVARVAKVRERERERAREGEREREREKG